MAVWAAFILSTLAVYCSVAEGGTNYNPGTHICCNGTVHVSKQGDNTACCGTQAFDFTAAICCGDQVAPMPPGDSGRFTMSCCYSPSGSAAPYDHGTHECCEGAILAKPDKEAHYGCCAGKLYDFKTQLCCGDAVLERHAGDECCGSKVYNMSQHVCCEQWGLQGERWAREYSETFERKGEHTFCCGRGVYDASAEVCCNDKVLAKPAGVAPGSAGCCGDQAYDFQSQVCCQKFSNATGLWAAEASKIRDKVEPGSSCCGLEVFDHRSSVCCEEKVLPKPAGMSAEEWGGCCGDQVMASFETQVCDQGKIVERNNSNLWPCGDAGRLFDVGKQTCCFGEVLDDADNMACCHLARKAYNTKKENCCGTEVVPLTKADVDSGNLACCTPFPHFMTFVSSARP